MVLCKYRQCLTLNILKPILARVLIFEPCHEKTWFMPYAKIKDADQPALPRSLISVFVVCYLDSIIPILDTTKISKTLASRCMGSRPV